MKALNRDFIRLGVLGILAAQLVAGGTGCVRRTVTIKTVPEGATVLLNDQNVGTTPVTVDFTWHGDYDVTVRKEGYETLKTHQRLKAPWYEWPGIDLFSEVFYPGTLEDKKEMCFTLEPRQPIDRQQLLKDAADFRERTLFGSE